MSRTRLLIGLVIVIALSALGYTGYVHYLAPAPATPATSTPAAGAAGAEAPDVVTAEGKIQPARQVSLTFRTSERVAEVLVDEGQSVQAGQVLIRLDSADVKAAVAQAQAAVSQARGALSQAEAAVGVAQANLDQLLAGPRPEQVAVAEAQYKAAQAAVGQAVAQRDDVAKGADADTIAAAQAQLAQAQAQQKELQIAYDQIIENIKYLAGPTEEKARFQLNAANQAVTAAQAALDQVNAGASTQRKQAYNSAVGVAAYQRDAAKAQLDLLKAGATPEQIEAGRAQVKQAQAGVDAARAGLEVAQAGLQAAQTQLAQLELTAPFDGSVVKLDLEVGELAAPGVPVITLADQATWKVVTSDLAETDVVLVRPGQAASVTLDAFSGQTFAGTVTEIAQVSETNRGNVTYAVTVELAPASAPLRWGMTAFVDIRVK